MSMLVIEAEPVPAYSAAKTLENHVRRRARRLGYLVTKSREWKYIPHSRNAGGYMLCDEYTNFPIFGWNYDASLVEIEEFLQQEEAAS